MRSGAGLMDAGFLMNTAGNLLETGGLGYVLNCVFPCFLPSCDLSMSASEFAHRMIDRQKKHNM